MRAFRLSYNMLPAAEVPNYKILENDNFYSEVYAKTEVSLDYLNRQIVSIHFYLKKSYHKMSIAKIDFDYEKHEIISSFCLFCDEMQRSNRYTHCYHIIYLLTTYNDGLIEGALSKQEIDILFNKILEEKRKKELEQIRKQNLKFLEVLEERIKSKESISSIKKASIIPNFECNRVSSLDYKTTVDIKIKVDKAYVVKDLQYFIYMVTHNIENQYGKNFSFKHNINNFEEKSKKFVNLLINYCYDTSWDDKKSKILSPMATQSMIETFDGEYIYVNGEETFVSLEEYEPIISVKNDNLFIEDADDLNLIIGNDYDFVSLNGVLYKLACEDEFRELVRFILGNQMFNFESIKDEFSKRVISRFTDEIELDDNFKDEYLIKDLKIEAYFDYYIDDEGNIHEDIIEVKSKYYLDDVEIDEETIINNNFISKKYTKYQSILNDLGFVNGKIEDLDALGDFLTCDLENLKKCCVVYLSDNISGLKLKKLNPIITNISYQTGMLDVCFEDLNFSDEELYKIIKGLRKKSKFIRLSKNVIFKADEEIGAQLLNVVDEFNLKTDKLNENQQIPLYQGMKLMNEENIHNYGKINMDDSIQNMINEIAHYKEANFDIPIEVKDVLREYQVNAYNWLKTLVKYNFCGILADDMGLGKTLEIITLLLSDPEEKPSLIVCPKSLIYNWQSECRKWGKSLEAIVISGGIDDRKKILKSIKNDRKTICITSYDSLKNDLELYKNKKFRFSILDEAQFIKNHYTLKAKSVKQITSELRFALTGTPIENTVLDLWSLFDFLMPNYLYKFNSFKDDFEKEIINRNNKQAVKKLVKKITPFVLRRTKKEVLKDLPDKIETIRYATMGEDQRKIYEAQLLKTRMALETKTKFMVLSDLTRLRQLCVHPKMFVEDYEGDSCKVDLVMELLDDLIPNGHKVLMFSQFTSIFSLIEKKLNEKNIDYYTLTGQTPSMVRVQMAEEFNKPNSSQKVFLISLKAGGTGLNLVGADTVIQLDPWWNISAENQASDRAHRIGQKNIVQVIKIICENSIEQKVIELQEAKKDVIDQVIADNDENIVKLSDSDIKYLLN